MTTLAFSSSRQRNLRRLGVRASQQFHTEAYWDISKAATHTLMGKGEGTPSSEMAWGLCESKYVERLGIGSSSGELEYWQETISVLFRN